MHSSRKLPKALVAIVTFVTLIATLVTPASATFGRTSSSTTLAYSTSPDRSGAMALDGAAIEIGTELAIFADTNRARKAVFYVNGKFAKTEYKAPYDLAGTRHDGTAATVSADHFNVGSNQIDVYVQTGWFWSRKWTKTSATFNVVEPAIPTIGEVALGTPEFSTLVAALGAASASGPIDFLAAVTDPEADLTVFAPTNDAFALLGDAVPAALADPDGLLTDILSLHVLGGSFDAATLTQNSSVVTLGGESITVDVIDGQVFLNRDTNDALVIAADVQTANGIIHVIDRVLLPAADEIDDEEEEEEGEVPELPVDYSSLTIAQVAQINPDFEVLATALTVASNEGPVNFLRVAADPTQELTVFAPTNAAFLALGDTLDAALADPAGLLTNVLLYHIAADAQSAGALLESGGTPTLLGPDVTVSANDDGAFVNGNVQILAVDIQTANGIIHVIDAVLLPPTLQDPDEVEGEVRVVG